MRNLWLIGMMGAGKTSAGRQIAQLVGAGFVDTDTEIASRLGCSVGELWGSRGEDAFRDMEAAQVAALGQKDGIVIATGGGVVLRPENVTAMRDSGRVVWLVASPEMLARRLGRGEGRPLLIGDDVQATLARLLEEREGLYAAAAHVRVETDDLGSGAVAEEVMAQWTGS